MTERLNARIDAELARKVLHLRDVTGKSTTEVIKASIDAYYERVAGGHRSAKALADFVGSAQGSPELSSSYKAALSDSLERKGRK